MDKAKKDPKAPKTAAEWEEERRQRDAAWWQKVITWYLNREYHAQVEREIAKGLEPAGFKYDPERNLLKGGLVQSLFKKEEGKASAAEILERMDKYQDADSPFRKLLKTIKKDPPNEFKVAESLNKCVEEAPAQILGRRRGKAVYRKGPGTKPEREGPAAHPGKERELGKPGSLRRLKEDERFRMEMTLLHAVMPLDLYAKLCQELTRQGQPVDPEKDFLFLPDDPRRESVLGKIYGAMRREASGKGAAYHRALNAMDRFMEGKGEPDQAEKNALAQKLGEYVLTDGAPGKPGYQPRSAQLALAAVRELLPEKDFGAFMDTVNAARAPDEKLKAEDLDELAVEPQIAPRELKGPVLKKGED